MAPNLCINRVLHLLIVVVSTGCFSFLYFHFNLSQTLHVIVYTALTVSVFAYFMKNSMSTNGRTFCEQPVTELIAIKLEFEDLKSPFCDHISKAHKRCVDCSNTPDGSIIGFVHLSTSLKSELRLKNLCLSTFRSYIRSQVEPLPKQFNFISKQGWPVSVSQEPSLLLSSIVSNENVVLIRRSYDKHKFGVVTTNHLMIGFVFAEFNDSVSTLRNILLTNLKQRLSEARFIFVDKNNWPVAEQQEESVIVWDLERNKVISIMLNVEEDKSKDEGDGELPDDEVTENDGEFESPNHRMRHMSDGKMSTATTAALTDISQEKDALVPLESSLLTGSNGHKPILISYVRQEAERHARQLKLRLEDLGCQVFLDIDEIKGGHDWQDALNRAVVNCSVFVPLITPQYGLTLWTNREVKLADMKTKVIIPVNFLDYWPPECLAIQFASTQYLDWKSKVDIEEALLTQGERARDIRYWDEPFVQRTAEEILQRFLASCSTNTMEQSTSLNSLNQTHHFNLKNISPEDVVDKMDELSKVSTVETESTPPTSTLVESVTKIGKSVRTLFRSSASPGKQMPLIVISAHPKERFFVELLRKQLQQISFEVWSSTDMCIGTSFENVNNDLSTIDDMSPASPVCHSLPIIHSIEDNVFQNNIGSFVIPEDSEGSQGSQRFIVPAVKPMRPRFLDTSSFFNTERKHSYSSDVNGSQNSLFTPEDLDKANEFKRKVKRARMVIVIFSQTFVNSKTCKSQLFYCDFRKTVLPILYEECRIPHCFMKMIGADLFKRDNASSDDDENFVSSVVTKVNNVIIAPKEAFKAGLKDAKILAFSKQLSKKIPFVNDKRKTVVIFVTGGSKFYNTSSEAVCSSIAQMLAAKDNVILVTSGFYGVAETVGRHFYDYRIQMRDKNSNNIGLYHILPRQHTSDLRLKCRQTEDKTFDVLPFGETLFIGDSLQERDAVIARIFHYCILIEGGPYSANLAKEFIWNDNTVIPIMSTGGAASGQYDCTAKVTEMPACVDENDWKLLAEKGNSADDTASTLLRVLNSLVEWRKKNCSEKKNNRHCVYFKNRRKFNRNAKPKKDVVVESPE